jgi:hypothetical protein
LPDERPLELDRLLKIRLLDAAVGRLALRVPQATQTTASFSRRRMRRTTKSS